MSQASCDYLIIGAGIIGLSIAYELIHRTPYAKIIILEKEAEVALHASGRNSGVLHAGFYYTADSLKAKFCVEGNRRMKAFCKEHGLLLNACQKLVVAKNEAELAGLDELYRRGQKNGVELHMISAAEAKKIDVNAKTYQKALLSPNTASVDPKQVCKKLRDLLGQKSVNIITSQKVKKCSGGVVYTQNAQYRYAHLVNAAGLYADKLAKQFGLAKKYTTMPFKGVYLKHKGNKEVVKTNIYPVPNLNNPFLGVHFTKTAYGDVKIGPTAIPAFWRENYQGLKNFSLTECLQVMYHAARLWWRNAFNFRQLAWSELRKYRKSVFIDDSRALVEQIDNQFYAVPAGIRAQLLNKETCELVMDFLVEQTENSTHVLNAVSPGFTCAFSFAEHVVNLIEENK